MSRLRTTGCAAEMYEKGERGGGSERGGGDPSPPGVRAEGGLKLLKSSWRQRRQSKIMAVIGRGRGGGVAQGLGI